MVRDTRVKRKTTLYGLVLILSLLTTCPGPSVAAVGSGSPETDVRPDSSEWAGLLRHGTPEQRRTAAENIPDPPPPAAASELIRALEDVQIEVRIASIYSLINLADKRAVEAIRRALQSPIPEIREAAVWSLLELADRSVADEIRNMLADDAAKVRVAAAWYVGNGAQTADLDALILARLDNSFEVREAVAFNLGKTGYSRAFESVEEMLEDKVAAVRIAACTALGGAPIDHYSAPLHQRLADTVPEVRSAAANALIQMDDPAGSLAIDAMAGSTDALVEIGLRREASLVPFLGAMLESEEASVRQASAAALGASGLPQAEQPLSKFGGNIDPRDRLAAASARGALRDAGPLTVLVVQLWSLLTWPITLLVIALAGGAMAIRRIDLSKPKRRSRRRSRRR